jgi:PAT family beta-lactamase induction signal transducer AmpG
MEKTISDKKTWLWVPSLYFTEGLPYIMVISVSVIMYKNLNVSNADIGLYTSLLYLPWVIKPLWSPIVDLFSTKRKWFFFTQLLISLSFLLIGFSMNTDQFFIMSLALFWLVAFSSATNDIASDGFYMIGLTKKKQSFFLGVRSLFYRLSMITGQGLIVITAGYMEERFMDNQKAWSVTMIAVAVMMLILTFINFFSTSSIKAEESILKNQEGTTVSKPRFLDVFVTFFKKKNIGVAIAFILLYRLGESQLVKMTSPFLLDNPSVGGLGLSTNEVGTIYGGVGVVALSLGGILGGIAISRDGLGKWILPMFLALNIPNLLYVLLAFFQPENIYYAAFVIFVEQFGYGFGFAAFLMYLIYLSEGITKTSHYAIATGFMALGMMIPGMISGLIQEAVGYTQFFIWVLITSLPGFIILRFLVFPADYGKK